VDRVLLHENHILACFINLNVEKLYQADWAQYGADGMIIAYPPGIGPSIAPAGNVVSTGRWFANKFSEPPAPTRRKGGGGGGNEETCADCVCDWVTFFCDKLPVKPYTPAVMERRIIVRAIIGMYEQYVMKVHGKIWTKETYDQAWKTVEQVLL